MEDFKKTLSEFIDEDIKATIEKAKINSFTIDFSWEWYFKFSLFDRATCILLNKMHDLSNKIIEIAKPELTQKEVAEMVRISSFFSDEAAFVDLKNKILLIKEEMIAKGQLVKTSYNEMEKQICQFFKTKRNIDFSLLSDEEKKELLSKEDIFISKENIYDYLNISHFQYKFLYQEGSFLRLNI